MMIGKDILGYRILEEIGRGAFGTVYRASKTNVLGTHVRALKVITLPTEKQYRDVLLSMGGDFSKVNDYFHSILEEVANEIRIMDTLSDRGIEQIVKYFEHDVVEDGDLSKFYNIYNLMEYMTPLSSYLDNHQMTEGDVIRFGKDILRALSCCHELNMIHRDVKDSNIFVSEDGIFKLGDFGVSKLLGDETSAATLKGTPVYIAPEVYMSGQTYDETVDLYSLGIILYRLLNHFRYPFLSDFPRTYNGRDEFLALEKRMSGQIPKSPSQAPAPLGQVILKAISPRDSRFDSAQEFLEVLEQVESDLDASELSRELASVLSTTFAREVEPVASSSLDYLSLDDTVHLEATTLGNTLAVDLASINQSASQSSLGQLFETVSLDGRGISGLVTDPDVQAVEREHISSTKKTIQTQTPVSSMISTYQPPVRLPLTKPQKMKGLGLVSVFFLL